MVDLKMAFDTFQQRLRFGVHLDFRHTKCPTWIRWCRTAKLYGFGNLNNRNAFSRIGAEETRVCDVLRFILERECPSGIDKRIVGSPTCRIGYQNFNGLRKRQPKAIGQDL